MDALKVYMQQQIGNVKSKYNYCSCIHVMSRCIAVFFLYPICRIDSTAVNLWHTYLIYCLFEWHYLKFTLFFCKIHRPILDSKSCQKPMLSSFVGIEISLSTAEERIKPRIYAFKLAITDIFSMSSCQLYLRSGGMKIQCDKCFFGLIAWTNRRFWKKVPML